MTKLSSKRAQLRAAIIDAKEDGDREREAELAAQCKAITAEYEAAASRRRAARRLLIDHSKSERRA